MIPATKIYNKQKIIKWSIKKKSKYKNIKS